MLFLSEVLVNWFDGEENGYEVCPFYEWNETDLIRTLKIVPLIKVTTSFFDFVENFIEILPKNLLMMVHKKTVIEENKYDNYLEYCFVLTDGKQVLAVDTMGFGKPIRKSRLHPKMEILAIEKSQQLETRDFPFNKKEKNFGLLNPHPSEMVGLTRKERRMKYLLYASIQRIEHEKDLNKLKYLFAEWDTNAYRTIKEASFTEIFEIFLTSIKYSWTKKHQSLCAIAVKGEPILEKKFGLLV